MRILYSHRTRSGDGQRVHIRALSDALAARGVSLFAAGPDEFGVFRERPMDARAGEGTLRRMLPRAAHELAEIAYSAPAYLRLARAAAQFRPDLIYERYALFHHAGLRLARARNLPLMLEVNAPLAHERETHGGLAFPALARLSERSLWRAADLCLPVSGVLARRVIEAGAAPDRVHVIHNGVEKAFLAPADPRAVRERYRLEGKLVLGFAGFVRGWHRVDFAVKFLAENEDRDMRLLIVGDGTASEALRQQARALGVAERVIITGAVQREALPAHIAAFDIALQPAATAYASPLKLFEYMALARPVVAPDQENIREILTGDENAALFRPGDEQDFRCALDRLVADRELRARLGAAARATVEQRELTWSANAARVERLAQSLLELRHDTAH